MKGSNGRKLWCDFYIATLKEIYWKVSFYGEKILYEQQGQPTVVKLIRYFMAIDVKTSVVKWNLHRV